MSRRSPFVGAGRAAAVALVIAVVVGACAAVVVGFDLARPLRDAPRDPLQARGPLADDVVVVALDEAFQRRAQVVSTASYAALAGMMRNADAKTIVVLPEVLDAAADAFGEQFFADFVSQVFRATDNVVYVLPPTRVDRTGDAGDLPRLRDPIPAFALADAARMTGIDTTASSNGRTMPLAASVSTGGDTAVVIPSGPLAAWLRSSDHADNSIVVEHDALTVNDRRIPVENHGALRVRYVDALLPDGSRVISVLDLIDGRVPLSNLRGKTVMLGVTDPATGRMVDAPVAGGTLASTFVHANAVNTLLTRDFLVPASDWSTVSIATVIAFVVAWAALLTPLWACWIAPLLIALGVWLAGRELSDRGTLADVGVWYGAILLAFVVAAGGKAALEIAQRRRITNLFSRYVPPSVARDLLDEAQAAALLEGEAVIATVLFCDIRGFTTLTSTLSPREVRTLSDLYYDALARIILDHNGTVMGYVGDEVYAVFGAPAPTPKHEHAAIACARAIHGVRGALNTQLAQANIPPIGYGIGINTGELVSAVVGSDARRQYAVIGNSMNLGARLCSDAAAGEIVVSESTFDALDETMPPWEQYATTLKGIDGTPTLYRCRC